MDLNCPWTSFISHRVTKVPPKRSNDPCFSVLRMSCICRGSSLAQLFIWLLSAASRHKPSSKEALVVFTTDVHYFFMFRGKIDHIFVNLRNILKDIKASFVTYMCKIGSFMRICFVIKPKTTTVFSSQWLFFILITWQCL